MAVVKVLLLLMAAGVAAELHSLSYHERMSTGGPRPLRWVVDGYVDQVHIIRYKDTGAMEPRQDWMEGVLEEHWASQTNTWADDLEVQRRIFEEMPSNGGARWVQRISRCMWNNETGEVKGHHRFAYNGRDFIEFHLEEQRWVALTAEAEAIRDVLNRRVALNRRIHSDLTQECPERLRMYLQYGGRQLLRKEPPEMFLLQKNSSSPIVCRATGFFPQNCEIFWRKDGEVLRDHVEATGTLPNGDGTFQTKAELLLRLADWTRYQCVFTSDGRPDVTLSLDEGLRNSDDFNLKKTLIITLITIFFITIIFIIMVLYIWRRKRRVPEKPSATLAKLVQEFSPRSSGTFNQTSSVPSEASSDAGENEQLSAAVHEDCTEEHQSRAELIERVLVCSVRPEAERGVSEGDLLLLLPSSPSSQHLAAQPCAFL